MRAIFRVFLFGIASLLLATFSTQAQNLPRDNPEAFYYGVDYTDLTAKEQELWATLGWDETSWEAETPMAYPATEWSQWEALTADQQDALAALGYDATMWDDSRPRAPEENVEDFWDALEWEDLSPAEQNLWGVLGWNTENWSGPEAEPESEAMDWDGLSEAEQFAAGKLGYNQMIWDGG